MLKETVLDSPFFKQSFWKPFNSCSGVGTQVKQETVDIEIPKGAVNGSFMSMPQYGNWTRGGVPGDLQIVVEEIPDPIFKREELNLIYDENVSVVDAILGTEKTLKIPHGTEIKFTIAPDILLPQTIKSTIWILDGPFL